MSARLKVARAASPRPHNVAPPMQRTMMIFAVSEVYMRVERVIKCSCLNEMIPEREQQHLIEDVIDHIMENEHLRIGKDGAYIWGATLMQVCECRRRFAVSRSKTPFLPLAGGHEFHSRVLKQTNAVDVWRRSVLGSSLKCGFGNGNTFDK